MKQLFKKRSILTLLLAVFAAVSLFGSAFAGTTDPYLDAYDDNLDTPVRTYVLANDETDVLFFISPRAIAAPDAPPTYFDSEADALAVGDTLNVVLDTPPSLSGADIVYYEAAENNPGEWFLQVYVSAADDQSYGSLSVEATNPGSTSDENYINVTIARQEEAPAEYTSAADIEVRVYNPGSTAVYTAAGMTVSFNDFYEDPLRTFPTALDGLIHAYYYDASFNSHVSNINWYNLIGTGYFVLSMTVDNVTYGTTSTMGWQYRVYRGAPNQPKVPLSEVVFSDSFMLEDGDVIVWAYGGLTSPILFPPNLAIPGPADPAAPEVPANLEG